ncbi:MFS transporter [Cellulomonas sp. zg-ZUI222]|uniref:MFS transporter n=1 Tax=Cellulomonas TaxID=1707 RepID=UPI001A952E27|nr:MULTISPECIES: MFS transporter [Cellulomonas]MBO0898623.1 MFS transporter [Cellulomonas sp. zg-ZUI22]MBO0919485.1 MFS transporter [Cellulomonas wangleii]
MQVISDLRALWPLTGFRRLFAVRLVSQASDGMFQIGLATLFFFSPENASTATGVAAAFAVLLLPFTIVGPWAGVLLDRWRRRQVLLYGNLVRVALTVVIAVIMLTSGVGPAVYVLALAALSVNRFLLAALSASLPKVVDGPLLLTANSLTPTLGAAAAGVGGALGFVLGLLLPTGRVRDATSLLVAAAVMACASALATRLGPDQLGPDERTAGTDVRRALGHLARGLVDGARYLVARRTPAYALGIMALHRFCYGAVFIASILISRNLLSDPADVAAGLATFGSVLAASAAGFALAVVLTPVLSPRVGPHVWIVLCLLLAVVSQLLLAFTVTLPAVLGAGAALGLAAQGAKIAVDTIVQHDTADAYRGRAFALYDVMYNAAFVGAAAVAAVALPDTGWSPVLFAGLAAVYLAGAVVFARSTRTPVPIAAPPAGVTT